MDYNKLCKPLTFWERFIRFDVIFVYIITIIIWALFLGSYLLGINSTWYMNLQKSSVESWLISGAWVIAGLLSYVGLYFIWANAREGDIPHNLVISVLFVISSWLFFAWGIALYQGENIQLALAIASILFVYQFWIFLYIWFIKPLAAIFMIPLLIMYVYLIHSMIELAQLNNIQL